MVTLSVSASGCGGAGVVVVLDGEFTPELYLPSVTWYENAGVGYVDGVPADSAACFLTASRSRMNAFPSAFALDETRRRWTRVRGAAARARTRAASIEMEGEWRFRCDVWFVELETWADGQDVGPLFPVAWRTEFPGSHGRSLGSRDLWSVLNFSRPNLDTEMPLTH